MAPSHRWFKRISPQDPELTRAEAFDLLSNKRRRGVIHYLRQTGADQVEVDEVIDAVVAWETGDRPVDISESQRASVYSSLLQTHLPRLEAAGVIRHDDGLIEPTDRTREIELYLEYAPRDAIPWAEYYLALCGVSAAALAVVWADLPPFDAVSVHMVAVGIVGVMLLSAGVHFLETRRSRLGSEVFERSLEAD